MEEQATQPSRNKRHNIYWTPIMDDLALKALVEQAQLGRKGDNGFQREVYVVVVSRLKERIGITITRENIINRMRTWKKEYLSMKRLIGISGAGWNPVLGCVDASDDFWEKLLETDPDLAPLRMKSFHNYQNMSVVIGDDQATGDHSFTGHDIPDNVQVNLSADSDGIEELNPEHMCNSHQTMGNVSDSIPTTPRNRGREESQGNNSSKKARSDKMTVVLKKSIEVLASAVDRIGDVLNNPPPVEMMARIYDACYTLPEIDEAYASLVYDKLSISRALAASLLALPVERRLGWIQRHFGPPEP